MKILVADDEDTIREVISLYLKKEGFIVFEASDGEEALAIEEKERPDLLLLDIMLPKMTGLELCECIDRNVPIIFLTAKTAEQDKILGFSLGADDYITKPFSPREVVARIKAVMRRNGFTDKLLNVAGLMVDTTEKSAAVAGKSFALSPREFDLLTFFMRHPKQTFSRQQLILNIWGYAFDGDDRTVDATIKRLRQKLLHEKYEYIHTIRGFGYRFEVLPK